MERRFFISSQAAEYIGVSLSTLYRMDASGIIKPVRTPGGHRRYLKETLDAYIDGSLTAAQPAVTKTTKPARVKASRPTPKPAETETVRIQTVGVTVSQATIAEPEPVVYEQQPTPPAISVQTVTAVSQTHRVAQQNPIPERTSANLVTPPPLDLSDKAADPFNKPSHHVLDLRPQN